MAIPPPSQEFGGYGPGFTGDTNHQDHQQYSQHNSEQSPPQQQQQQQPPQPPPQQQQQFQYVDQQQYPSANLNSFDTSAGADSASLSFSSASETAMGKLSRSIGIRYQHLLDTVTPHWAARWTFSLVILLIFMARIVIAQGWYVICYGLSIYYLNLFIGFLSPKIDPAFQAGGEFDVDDFDNSDVGPMLPTKANDEFRPFIRRLPEFKFWLSATKATLISLFLTLFEAFDLPVFWPILLLYFILLFVSTMRQQIKHMIRYGYVPWDKGKKKYGKQNQEPASLFSPSV